MAGTVEREGVAKPRDLSDQIAVADSKKTIFTSMVKKGTAPSNVLLEWPVDSFPAASVDGAVDEADVTEFEDLGAPDEVLSTRLQIWERKPKVSRLSQVTVQAGVPKKKAYAKAYAKGLIMVKRDIEVTCLSDEECRVGTSKLGNKTRGLLRWAQSTAQSIYPVPEAYRTPATSITTETIANTDDDLISDLLKSRYDETGDGEAAITGIVGSTLKLAYSKLSYWSKDNSGYTLVRRMNQDAAAKKIVKKIDILEMEFGTVILRASSFINTGGDPTSAASRRLGIFFEEDDVSMRFATEPSGRPLPDQGGGPRALIEAIGALIVKNPLTLAKHAPSA